jgi:tRNA-specific 2-thiouridylase
MIAMSGGVDSSVAALLLSKAGYPCEGVTMRLFDSLFVVDKPSFEGTGMCGAACSDNVSTDTATSLVALDAAANTDAARVANYLGIGHQQLDLSDAFTAKVVSPFVCGYRGGETPNPCIDCNREIKFGALFDHMLRAGFDQLATGHYARIVYDEQASVFRLLKAFDSSKDQSYMLYQLGQAELSKLVFPLGEMSKDQVRELAAKAGLPAADRPESQDICFVIDSNYQGFLSNFGSNNTIAGEIVDQEGTVLGQHFGIEGFTIGQRRGLGVAVGHPLYVTDIDAETGCVTVGEQSDLYGSKALLRDFRAPVPKEIEPVMEVWAKHRYRSAAAPARLVMFDDGRFEVQFDQPQKALTPGQALVCYIGDQVVAGGIIDKVRK